VNISELYENQYSSNQMDEETYLRIKEDIAKNGFLEPNIYYCSDGEVISGNHRVRIARELGREGELKLIPLGDLSLDKRMYLVEMFNTRGVPNLMKLAIIFWNQIEQYLSQGISRSDAVQKIAFDWNYTPGLIDRLARSGERITKDHPWFLKEVDGKIVTWLHAHYLLNFDRSRRIYVGPMNVEERESVMRKMLLWLREQYIAAGKCVSADTLQAKIRSTLVSDLGKVLPDLTDVPWASIWWPEKRVESIRHIIEDGTQLGTYKVQLKSSINRLTRVSSFSMSVAFNLIRLLTRKILVNEGGSVETFKNYIIVDPFMGYGIRVVTARYLGHVAYGYDISAPTVDKLTEELWSEFKDSFFVGDARNLPHENETVDLVFTSPPYWNLEKYEGSQEEGQLSKIKDYELFLKELFKAFDEMKRITRVDGYIVLVVGNFRVGHKYYPFVEATERYLMDLNLELWDKIILSHDVTRPMGGIKSIEKNHTRTAHEEMLIFKKVR